VPSRAEGAKSTADDDDIVRFHNSLRFLPQVY
jgi:hypothetical protein